MKVSIVSVCYNAEKYIKDCLESVSMQDYEDIEHIVVDGASKDGTLEIIKKHGAHISKLVSESDKGLYDAMNKGIALTSGAIIGMLNADDLYPNPGVISRIVKAFKNSETMMSFGDLVYVNEGNLDKVVRYYQAHNYQDNWWSRGMMPPHPTFFVRKELYDRYGTFDTSFEICADFDLMLRLFHKEKLAYSYIPETLVKMRTGGSSTQGLKSTLTINQEMLRSCKMHGVNTHYGKIYSKYFSKVFQLINKPKEIAKI
ncbi:MAG: glycosyltransferase family 2 protein [Bacteroidota bacterium]